MAYYTPQRKAKAVEDLRLMHECADEAGVRHALFVGFGLLLGIVRERDFISHDDDVDMCVLADHISPEQELKYYRCLQKRGFFKEREKMSFRKSVPGFAKSETMPGNWAISKKIPKQDERNFRFAWFTLRRKAGHGKFCHWFMFNHGGYAWHTKAGKWLKQRKFDKNVYDYTSADVAIMKGVPQEYIGNLVSVKDVIGKDFYGINLLCPEYYLSCLDFWYGNWIVPRKGGSSAKKVTCVVGDWDAKETWKIKVN